MRIFGEFLKRSPANSTVSGLACSLRRFGGILDQVWIPALNFTPKKIACRHSELEQVVLPLLRGRVFHVTTEEAFNDICRCGWIDSQRQVEFFFNPARSANCYGRNRRWVSVYDLSNGSESEIKHALTGYWLFKRFRIERTYVFLIVVESAWPSLISWKHATREVGGKELFVPFVEAWYPGNMSIDLFSESLAVSVHSSLAVV
jgi:hypothetical protein